MLTDVFLTLLGMGFCGGTTLGGKLQVEANKNLMTLSPQPSCLTVSFMDTFAFFQATIQAASSTLRLVGTVVVLVCEASWANPNQCTPLPAATEKSQQNSTLKINFKILGTTKFNP